MVRITINTVFKFDGCELSCSKEKLKNILENSINHDSNCTYTIEQVDLYVVSKCKDGKILFHKLVYYDEEFVKNKIYGSEYLFISHISKTSTTQDST